MRSNDDLMYIKDANDRKLYYHFTPASIVSNFIPLVVILDGEKNDKPTHFEYKMWNVLTPIDNFGYENKGSCWLGEKGDFFVKDLLQTLIHQIAEEYECEDHIYIYGNSMGGYGAILHGILSKANAVFANAPRIRLENTSNTNSYMQHLYASVFGTTPSEENDLTNFLNSTDSFPIFYLCDKSDFNPSSDETYIESETVYFVNVCKKYNLKVHLDFCPKSENDEAQSIKEVLNFFERVASEG